MNSRTFAKITPILTVLIAAAVAFNGLAQGQTVPQQINYQGMLLDAGGATLPDGDYTVSFSIYTNSSGPGLVWGPEVFDGQQLLVGHGLKATLVGGRFNVVLGPLDVNGTNIVSALGGTNRYLEIIVGGTTNIVPRQQLLSSPFALRAVGADAADNLSSSGYTAVFANTNIAPFIPGNRIQNGSITTLQISNAAINSAQIATGAVTTVLIASNAVSGDKLQLPLSLSGLNALWLLVVTNGFGPAIAGVSGQTHGVFGQGPVYGVYGQCTSGGYGIYGVGNPHAALFSGDVTISGTLNGLTKAFKIDHPLDPANQYLSHSSVESADMKNIYDGVATLNADGRATVVLPSWFEALNKDFRYQLTAIGAPSPNLHIAEEIANNQFTIAGGVGGTRVSWQVTGIRHDAWAEAHRIRVEEPKTGADRGLYLTPREHGQPKEKGVYWKLGKADVTAPQ
jgi:hypothetical protein